MFLSLFLFTLLDQNVVKREFKMEEVHLLSASRPIYMSDKMDFPQLICTDRPEVQRLRQASALS